MNNDVTAGEPGKPTDDPNTITPSVVELAMVVIATQSDQTPATYSFQSYPTRVGSPLNFQTSSFHGNAVVHLSLVVLSSRGIPIFPCPIQFKSIFGSTIKTGTNTAINLGLRETFLLYRSPNPTPNPATTSNFQELEFAFNNQAASGSFSIGFTNTSSYFDPQVSNIPTGN